MYNFQFYDGARFQKNSNLISRRPRENYNKIKINNKIIKFLEIYNMLKRLRKSA